MKILRYLLIALAIVLIAVPVAIVSITGNGWGEFTARLLISLSITSLIAATLIGIRNCGKTRSYLKIGISIGLLIVLLSQWL